MRTQLTPPPDLGANHEGDRRDRYMSVSTLAREARKLCADMGLHISGSRLRKIVRRFLDEGRADVDLRTYLLWYADPTGNTAVRNVMRGGR